MCVVWERDGKKQPLAFFSATEGVLDERVGRGTEGVDITVPSPDGRCGISRYAFHLKRSASGIYSILSRNTVPFFIRSPERSLRVDGFRPTSDPVEIELQEEDKLFFNNCSLYLYKGTSAVPYVSTSGSPDALPASTRYLLEEAVGGLSFS